MLKNIIILLLSLTLLGACDGDNSTNNNPANESGINNPPEVTLQSIRLSANKTSLYIGESAQLSAMAKYSDDSTKDITNKIEWTSTESNYTYSSTTKGLVYGIHAGTKPITVSYGDKTSNTIDLTIKPTLFYAISNDIYGTAKIYAPYGLISDKFLLNDSTIYSLTLINNKLYSCCKQNSLYHSNIIGVLDLTKANESLSFINDKPKNAFESKQDITEISHLHTTLIAKSLWGLDGRTSYWDESNLDWNYITLSTFYFTQKDNKLYAIGSPDIRSYDIYSIDISKFLLNMTIPWQKLVTSTAGGDSCNGNLYIINKHMYKVSKGKDEVFCIDGIDMNQQRAPWQRYSWNDPDGQDGVSSLAIESTIYISFKYPTQDESAVIYAFSNLESATLTMKNISIHTGINDDSLNKVILANIGTTIYAGAGDGTIWSLDTTKPNTSWQKDSELSHTGNDPITAMYVAY